MPERDPPDEQDELSERAAERAPERERAQERPTERASERSERGPAGRFRRLGRRILGDAEERAEARAEARAEGRPERTILGDAREVFGAVLEGSDKAKSEVVRAVAREVRNYLDELGLKDDVHNLLTNYSFEIHASVNLRRLADHEKAPREPRRVPRTRDDDPAEE